MVERPSAEGGGSGVDPRDSFRHAAAAAAATEKGARVPG